MRQAIILAAGQGLRMRPLTADKPKALLEVAGRPIIEHTMAALPESVDRVIVVVGYLENQIREFLGENFQGRKVSYVSDPLMKGTGYAVSLCRSLADSRFLAINGDDLYDRGDLTALSKFDHAMLCARLPGSQGARFGRILTEGRLLKGIGTGSDLVNAGAYALTSKFFDYELARTESGEYGLPQTMVSMADSGVPIEILKARFWVPIGFPEDLALAENILNEKTRQPN